MPAARLTAASSRNPLHPPSEHPVETKDVWQTLRPKHPVMLSDPAPGVAGRMLPSGHGAAGGCGAGGAQPLGSWTSGSLRLCLLAPPTRGTVLAEHAARWQTPGSRLATSPQRAHVLGGGGARVGERAARPGHRPPSFHPRSSRILGRSLRSGKGPSPLGREDLFKM